MLERISAVENYMETATPKFKTESEIDAHWTLEDFESSAVSSGPEWTEADEAAWTDEDQALWMLHVEADETTPWDAWREAEGF